MSAFDDLTLAEVEEVQNTCLGGKSFSDEGVNQLSLAGGVMWITRRRTTGMQWEEFKQTTRMSDIKEFSIEMETADLDPTLGHSALVT